MVDQGLNAVLWFLISGVFVSIGFLLEPSIVLVPPIKQTPASIPPDWVDHQGSWECLNVTPESLSGLLRVLRTMNKVPLSIRVEPPFAEVVWK